MRQSEPDPGITPATLDDAENPLLIIFRVTVDDSVNQAAEHSATLSSNETDDVTVDETWTRDDGGE